VSARRRLAALGLVLLLGAPVALAAALGDANAIPQLPPEGRSDYRDFLKGGEHRAFAIAPGGAWGWKVEAATADQASDAALETCRGNTTQKCVLYAVDDRVVFDARRWPTLWGPYKSARDAAAAPNGRNPGERFFDLAFSDPEGRRSGVAALQGRVVLLHFWGSWCGPCRREMPELQKLRQSLAGRQDIAFVLLQAHERIDVSRQWLKRHGLRLPLADSGSGGESDSEFTLAGGGKIRDRDIAMVFPTTYVLDRNGVVIFAHYGAVHDWPQYAPFLIDAAGHSGR